MRVSGWASPKNGLGLGIRQSHLTPVLTTPGSNAVNNECDSDSSQELRPTLAAIGSSRRGNLSNWWPINPYDAREGEMRDNSDCQHGQRQQYLFDLLRSTAS